MVPLCLVYSSYPTFVGYGPLPCSLSAASHHTPSPSFLPLRMEGDLERGGHTPTWADDHQRQQQQTGSQQSAPSPLPARGDGQPCGPPSAAPPHASQARGDRCGLTVRQQQQQQLTSASPPTDSQLARQAFSLYRQCMAAGQWARVNTEQRPDGEYITFSSRPWAAAPPAAARAQKEAPPGRTRRPNQRRLERKRLWLQSRGQQQHGHAARAARQQQQGPSCSQQLSCRSADKSLRQQQQLQSVRAAATAKGTYAQAAAMAAISVRGLVAGATASQGAEGHAPEDQPATARAAVAATPGGGAAISPRMTRARKRKKLMSPRDTTVITQLDGEDWSPTSSIPELQSPEAATRQDVVSEPDGVLGACLDRLHRKLHAGMYVEDCTRCQDSAT